MIAKQSNPAAVTAEWNDRVIREASLRDLSKCLHAAERCGQAVTILAIREEITVRASIAFDALYRKRLH